MRVLVYLRLLYVSALLACLTTSANGQNCVPFTSSSGFQVIQEFKINNSIGTAWRVVWAEDANSYGLKIVEAYFKRTPTENWIKVLGEARISQVWVPYHPGSPRIDDLRKPWNGLSELVPDEAGPCGELGPLVAPPPPSNDPARRVVAFEFRSRGIAHRVGPKLSVDPPFSFRRGHALVLWASYDNGNYKYIMEYGFRDDGAITFRLGSTGFNNPPFERIAHTHTALWRIDVDLAGPGDDTVYVSEHLEPLGSNAAQDDLRLFNNGNEGPEDWDPLKFTSLVIKDKNFLNRYGNQISYELLSRHSGIARHNEDYTRHDFWVTEANPSELMFEMLPTLYTVPAAPILDKDIVVWAMTASHHLPRDEDFGFPDRTGLEYLPSDTVLQPVQVGAALVMWSGFMLRPRNFFDNTPLVLPAGGPVSSGPSNQ